jgi:hypothetical protein
MPATEPMPALRAALDAAVAAADDDIDAESAWRATVEHATLRRETQRCRRRLRADDAGVFGQSAEFAAAWAELVECTSFEQQETPLGGDGGVFTMKAVVAVGDKGAALHYKYEREPSAAGPGTFVKCVTAPLLCCCCW